MASNELAVGSYRVGRCTRCKQQAVLVDGTVCVNCKVKAPAQSKYHNVKSESPLWPGVTFDSAKEMRRGEELFFLLKEGRIRNLERQVRVPCVVNGVKVCTYWADFRYEEAPDWTLVVEDVKGVRTPLYTLKARLVAAVHGIRIREV